MKYLMKWTWIALMAGLMVAGCQKDDDITECPCTDPTNPECENYDPCFGERPTSADFVIEQNWSPGVPDSLSYVGGTDKLTRGRIRFRALDEAASTYLWYLGLEQLEEPIIERIFGLQVPFGTMITVSLVVTKQEPNFICFPEDNGRDSISKSFFILNPCDFLVNNKYRGVYSHAPDDTVTIETLFDLPTSEECTGIAFSAFNFGNSGEWYANMAYPRAINNQLYFSGSGGATPLGLMRINEDTEEVQFNYSYFNTNWEFTGKIYHP